MKTDIKQVNIQSGFEEVTSNVNNLLTTEEQLEREKLIKKEKRQLNAVITFGFFALISTVIFVSNFIFIASNNEYVISLFDFKRLFGNGYFIDGLQYRVPLLLQYINIFAIIWAIAFNVVTFLLIYIFKWNVKWCKKNKWVFGVFSLILPLMPIIFGAQGYKYIEELRQANSLDDDKKPTKDKKKKEKPEKIKEDKKVIPVIEKVKKIEIKEEPKIQENQIEVSNIVVEEVKEEQEKSLNIQIEVSQNEIEAPKVEKEQPKKRYKSFEIPNE